MKRTMNIAITHSLTGPEAIADSMFHHSVLNRVAASGTRKLVTALGILLPEVCILHNSPTIVLLRNISVRTILMHAGFTTGKWKRGVHEFMGSEFSASGSNVTESTQTNTTTKGIQHSVPSHLFTVCVVERNVPALFGERTTEVSRCISASENSSVLHRAGHNHSLSQNNNSGDHS